MVRKWLCEFWMMALFVMIGVGTAMSNVQDATCASNTCLSSNSDVNPRVFQVALAFGMGIVVLVYSGASCSGGHVNCAVTTALMISGSCGILEGVGIIIAQFLGSLAGAGLLAAMIPKDQDGSGGMFGTNQVAPGFSDGNAFCAEFFGTLLLLFAVFHCAVCQHKGAKKPWGNMTGNFAPVAIGMSVFCAHCVLIPIDGCSINPTRTLGPLIVGDIRGFNAGNNGWDDLWIFMIAPECAAVVAGLAYRLLPCGAASADSCDDDACKDDAVGNDQENPVTTAAADPTFVPTMQAAQKTEPQPELHTSYNRPMQNISAGKTEDIKPVDPNNQDEAVPNF